MVWIWTAVWGQWQSLNISWGLFLPQKWCQQEVDWGSRGWVPLHPSHCSPGNHFTARATLFHSRMLRRYSPSSIPTGLQYREKKELGFYASVTVCLWWTSFYKKYRQNQGKTNPAKHPSYMPVYSSAPDMISSGKRHSGWAIHGPVSDSCNEGLLIPSRGSFPKELLIKWNW